MTVTVSFPSLLPLPTFEGFSIEPVDAVLRTEMESGPARQSLEFTDTPTGIATRWRFTAWEFALFESWFRYKAKEGAEYFSITLLGGLGMVEHEARFMGEGSKPYVAKPSRGGPGSGARWIVTTRLEIRQRPVLSEEALDIALVEDIPGLLAAIAAQKVLVNETLYANAW